MFNSKDNMLDLSRPRSKLSRWLQRLVALLIASYSTILVLMMSFETSILFPAPPFERSDWSPKEFRFEDVSFQSGDKTPLHGWFFEQPKASHAILFLHGNGEQVADVGAEMDALRARYDASVFAFDYRGYGKSQGRPSESGLVADGQAAQKWLAERLEIEPAEIILYGRSLGGGVAVQVASRNGAKALVLDRTFYSIVSLAAEKFRWIPVRWLMRNRFESFQSIADFQGPILQVHGPVDRVVPFESGVQLHQAATSPDKQFLNVPNLGHNDPTPEIFYRDLKTLLDRLAPISPNPPIPTNARREEETGG
jgi:fermentation-respiration switch protein FrsA (DUF1100 family)